MDSVVRQMVVHSLTLQLAASATQETSQESLVLVLGTGHVLAQTAAQLQAVMQTKL